MIDPKKKVVKILKKQALKTDPTGVIGNEVLDHTDQLDSMHEKLDAVKETIQQDKKSAAEERKYSATLQLPDGVNVITMKGEKGDKPEYKKDYLTEEELAQIKQEITPIKGQHYFTQQEIAQFVNAATPVKGVHYEDGQNGVNGMDGRDGIGIPGLQGLPGLDGKDGMDGVNPDPKEVIKELRLLKGNDRLDISNIRNAEQLLHGGGIVTIQSSGTEVTNKATVLNFTGSGVNSVTESLGVVTIDVSGGGGGSPGGADTQVQFNDNNTFGGDASFSWDKITKTLAILGGGTTPVSFGVEGVYIGSDPNTNIAIVGPAGGFSYIDFSVPNVDNDARIIVDHSAINLAFHIGQSDEGSMSFFAGGGIGMNSNLSVTGTVNGLSLSQANITTTSDNGLTIATGGVSSGTGTGTALILTAGTGGSTSGDGGVLNINGGSVPADGDGGDINVQLYPGATASSTSHRGGNFNVYLSGGVSGGAAGLFRISTPNQGYGGILDFSNLTADQIFSFPNIAGTVALTSQLPIFQTDGTPNGSQTLLNLKAGTNITLTDNGSGQITIDAAGGASGITIGTTTITSGTNTRILYNNAGIVGEYVISGSGNVAMTTSPVFTTPNIGSATGSISGNAGTATALQTARTIAGVSFNGTANIAIPASGLSNGVTGAGAVVLATSPTLVTAVLGSSTATTQTPGTSNTTLATTAFVANAILGQNFKEAAKYASTAALPAIVYSNGSSGVGATLTAVGFGAISLDGNTPSVNDRVLIKNQVSTFQNGIYTVTTVGTVAAVFVLTRTLDANQSFEFETGDSLFVTSGTTQSATTWAYTGIDSPTIGTDAITYVQTTGQGSLSSGNGITITGNSIAIDTSVTVDKTTVQTLTNKTLTSPVLTTPTLGVASATTINKLTLTTPASGSTLTILDGKVLTVNKTLTLDGTDSTIMTFPTTSATIARTDAAQTFTGTQTYSNAVIYTNNAIAASGNAATVPVTARLNTVTNNSAATLTITMATASAVDGQLSMVRILDFSAVAQTITWVNTEDSTVTAPTTSNGSTTLFLSALFMYNGGTSKWRCIGKA